MIHDFTAHGDRYVICRGGHGGRGNQHFATSTNQAPTRHDDGKPGQERRIRLELKLLADVGLVGFPNAGKSTLISRISAARPKIADYPFTTLEPHLGVVQADENRTFVVADIPGLIEGAHAGHGLGDRFLRHIERTHLLLHLVDVSGASGREPDHDFEVILNELASFSPALASKPMVVVATKLDAAQDREPIEKVRKLAEAKDMPFLEISAVTGQGIPELVRALADRVGVSRAAATPEPADLPVETWAETDEESAEPEA
jgi:GTP-binding protein